MNLKWKKIFGILTPTRRFERLEAAFLSASSQVAGDPLPSAVSEYRRLSLELKFAGSRQKKVIEQKLKSLRTDESVKAYIRGNSGNQKRFRDFRLTFREEFNAGTGNWKPGFYFPDERLKSHYSFHNEKQRNNEGKNTFFRDGAMQIYTRREVSEGLAWHPQKGFISKTFDYSSDVVHSADTFHQQGGLFRAKIRCTGNLNHAFWLGAGKEQPHISIFHWKGNELQVGFMNQNDGDATLITGINPAEYHIYSLEWTRNEMIWSINNLEVFRTTFNIPWQPMHLAFNSFIPQHIPGDEGLLEVDWVRVYQHQT